MYAFLAFPKHVSDWQIDILMIRVVALWGNSMPFSLLYRYLLILEDKILSNVLKVLIFCEAIVKIALVAKIDIILNCMSFVTC